MPEFEYAVISFYADGSIAQQGFTTFEAATAWDEQQLDKGCTTSGVLFF